MGVSREESPRFPLHPLCHSLRRRFSQHPKAPHGGGVPVGGIRWYLVHLLCMAAAAADVVESCSRTFYLVCMWFVVVGCVCVC